MNLYEVTYQNHTLNFLAEDRDHLLTLVSQMLDRCDYSNLIKELDIKHVAGKNPVDGFNFYLGLFNDSGFGPV